MKKIKDYKNTILFLLAILITIWLYSLFIKSPYFELIKNWGQENQAAFIGFLVLLKIIGLVWPPIPGGTLTLGAIPIIGWFPAYFADLLGNIIGLTMAFYIARRWGKKIVGKLLDKKAMKSLDKIKIKEGREKEASFLLTITVGLFVVEAYAYAAGLLNIKYRNFIIGNFFAHLSWRIPLFYLINNTLSGKNVIFNLVIFTIGALILLAGRKRYFESTSPKT